MTSYRPIAFKTINRAALKALPNLITHLLPDGRFEGNEFVALNPTRRDRRIGSFKINLVNGCWGDFATNEGGRDVVSLAAYLAEISYKEAAVGLASMLGVEPYE
jgi:hypothetical protein